MKSPSTLQQNALRLALASAFAVAGLSGINAYAASASSTATSTVIAPIAVAANGALSFGKFSSLASGTIKVEPNNAIAVTGGVLSGTGATATAARFDVTGDASNSYSISYTGDANLTSGADTMALTKVSALTATTSSTLVATGALSGGAQSIFVGGTLAVGANQPAGTYTGAVGVTVEYN